MKRLRRAFSRPVLVLSAILLAGVAAADNSPTFVGSAACASCHPAENADWKGSFHQEAMAESSSKTVLGDFKDATFTYNGIVSKFFRRGEHFYVLTDGADGRMQEFKIEYTFGVYPLQQYLVNFPGGRLQALNIAWDSRARKDGGRRWFHLQPNEKVDHNDVLHWTKLGQNWNFMCAECHSTNLQKNYDPEKRTFNTTWSEISVGCEACHGPASAHIAWAGKKAGERSAADIGFVFSLKSTPFLARHDPADGRTLPETARLPSKQVDACGRCHSRRGTITPEYKYGEPLMATHFPALLTPGIYYPDGQIEEEVYEYGSFRQSKMYQSGVGCSDCHNPHSLKLRLPGNAVCGQCHGAARYDSPSHHFHKTGTPGAECKSCHMAERKYMVIDARYDHSMRIPAPAMSAKAGAPNACSGCHQKEGADWAESQIRKHFGPAKPNFHDFGQTFVDARSGDPAAPQKLAELIADTAKPAIVRASAAGELAPFLSPDNIGAVQESLADKDPVVRAAATNALEAAPPQIRVGLLAPLLRDPVLGVRFEAARVLASVPQALIPVESLKPLGDASAEYVASQMSTAESPQAQVNIGLFYAHKGMAAEAERAYRTAIELEPQFVPASINLADLFRQTGRDKEGIPVLEAAVRQVPSNPEVHFALGLAKIRSGDKEKALKDLETATRLGPDNPRFAYVYIVALLDLGRKDEAQKLLALARRRFPNSGDLSNLDATLR